jgi:hypothetical protein
VRFPLSRLQDFTDVPLGGFFPHLSSPLHLLILRLKARDEVVT